MHNRNITLAGTMCKKVYFLHWPIVNCAWKGGKITETVLLCFISSENGSQKVK